jgi:hypothetical protein
MTDARLRIASASAASRPGAFPVTHTGKDPTSYLMTLRTALQRRPHEPFPSLSTASASSFSSVG